MTSTISSNVTITNDNVGYTNNNNDSAKITQIESKRLEYLLAIEKNYIQIIAQGVQSTINSTTNFNKK